nr:RluA family pseudouridine synthase [Haloferula luteola]
MRRIPGVRAICDFQVIDESPDWIVVDKPAPLMVHPANGSREPTLLSGLEVLLAAELAGGRGGLSILTRLDRETSGLVLVAKHAAAAKALSVPLASRTAFKGYHAISHGWPSWDEMVVDGPLRRAGEVKESRIWLRQCVDPGGKPATTHFRVLKRFEKEARPFCLLRCVPETGRTHQIRAHLEHVGHPLVGDKIYGTDGSAYLAQMEDGLDEVHARALLLSRQALHAAELALEWEGEVHRWECPMARDLARFLGAA